MNPSHDYRVDRARSRRQPLGLIGAGAFGAFAVPHLRRWFDVAVHDPRPDLAALCAGWRVTPMSLAEAAGCRIVVLAVPLSALRDVARAIAPHLRPDAVVVDVCSVKLRPLAILRDELPTGTAVVGTHPLFGPNSGRDGLAGLKVVVCGAGERASADVERFLARALGLEVVTSTAEAHDRQMASVQALSHLVARSLKGLALPDAGFKTAASARLDEVMDLIGDDSEALFSTIVGGNPFAPAVLHRFLDEARSLVARATCGEAG